LKSRIYVRREELSLGREAANSMHKADVLQLKSNIECPWKLLRCIWCTSSKPTLWVMILC